MKFDHSLDPFNHLNDWLKAAEDKGLVDPNAMTLSTLGSKEQPKNRVVLYKGLIRGGLSFFTNYEGEKAKEIADNNKVSLNFYWQSLARQVRIEGAAIKLSRQESEEYFKTRPRISQLGAWASLQSQEVDGLDTMNRRFQEIEKSFEGQEVACPKNWGGYHVLPHYFEFWIGREGRLHERYCYQRQGSDWRRFMRYP